mmetsp:Transcript_23622/g.52370  ORF Transcript_23622/g.52370 Transcript_23622/m.52370 type:complete len:202 (-) Transcript_23622:113-718(-)
MNVNRFTNKIKLTHVMDPYSMLMHYKRAFKLMRLLKENKAKVLVLGNKNQFGIDWKGRFEGVDFDTGIVDSQVIATAPKHYHMVLCLDPVLYARSLRRLNVPVMMCATTQEITQYPEILDVSDYLLPSPSSRHDAALRALVSSAELGDAGSSGAESSTARASENTAGGGAGAGAGAKSSTARASQNAPTGDAGAGAGSHTE